MSTLQREVLGHRVRPGVVAVAFALLGGSVALVLLTSAPWWVVLVGVVAPDLTFLAAVGDRPDAPGLMPPRAVPFYNALHRPGLPVALVVVAACLTIPTATALGLAWLSHIVWDRGVGYGLRDAHGAMR